jgi:hypothetical protein
MQNQHKPTEKDKRFLKYLSEKVKRLMDKKIQFHPMAESRLSGNMDGAA